MKKSINPGQFPKEEAKWMHLFFQGKATGDRIKLFTRAAKFLLKGFPREVACAWLSVPDVKYDVGKDEIENIVNETATNLGVPKRPLTVAEKSILAKLKIETRRP